MWQTGAPPVSGCLGQLLLLPESSSKVSVEGESFPGVTAAPSRLPTVPVQSLVPSPCGPALVITADLS